MAPNGGNYDGCIGTISSIEVVQTLKNNNIVAEHPLEVIIFFNEEGGVIGSRAIVGQLSEEVLKAVSHRGLTVEEGIHSPEEFSTGIDIANGANVLLNTILELDKKL